MSQTYTIDSGTAVSSKNSGLSTLTQEWLPNVQTNSVALEIAGEVVDVTVDEFRVTEFGDAQALLEGQSKTDAAITVRLAKVQRAKVVFQKRFTEEWKQMTIPRQIKTLSQFMGASFNSVAYAIDEAVFEGTDASKSKTATKETAAIKDEASSTAFVGLSASTGVVSTNEGEPITTDTIVSVIDELTINGKSPNVIVVSVDLLVALANERDSHGNKRHPELTKRPGVVQVAAFEGHDIVGSKALSVRADENGAKVKALVLDSSQLAVGVEKLSTVDENGVDTGVEAILFGDPDGNGDLKNLNHFVLRTEYFVHSLLLDPESVGVVIDAPVSGE